MGPQIIAQKPTFVADLFKYDSAMPALSKGLPRFMDPGAYAIRDRMLFMIKRWYSYAREHFDEGLGSEHMRYRQKVLCKVDDFDDDAIASSDLAQSPTNAIPCTFWALVHIYRDSILLSEIRAELRISTNLLRIPAAPSSSETQRRAASPALSNARHQSPPSPLESLFSTGSLLVQQPLLRSVYAEILRLYNTRGGLHPVSSFWASRFLVRPGDPDSGPLRRAAEAASEYPSKLAASLEDKGAPAKFSMSGLNGAWILYGGGSRVCPGRQFAKREILTTCAMVLATFDVEVLANEKALRVQGGRYGLGAQKPAGQVRVFRFFPSNVTHGRARRESGLGTMNLLQLITIENFLWSPAANRATGQAYAAEMLKSNISTYSFRPVNRTCFSSDVDAHERDATSKQAEGREITVYLYPASL
ncbi:hypothetical protein BDR22DRAFT_883817 [Usnea florida]